MIDSNQKKTTRRRLKKIKRKNPKRITIFYRKNRKWMRNNMKRDRWKINKNNMNKLWLMCQQMKKRSKKNRVIDI